ncbi:hypothetical protein ACLOJK_022455 [Asimina triloba]
MLCYTSLLPHPPSISINEQVNDGFLEAIEELERMAHDLADVLKAYSLSARKLHLVYFSQDGCNSWCALEVFAWLYKENWADNETVELMVTILYGFNMIEKVISVHWDMGKKAEAVMFVRNMLELSIDYMVDDKQGNKGDCLTWYLSWKMMACLSLL